MKLLKIFFLAAMGTIGVWACNSNTNTSNNEDTTQATDTTIVTTTPAPVDNTAVNMNLDTAAVPVTVRTSFEKKYPQATNPKWAKYQPREDSYKDMYPDMDLDTSDYWVIYTWNDIDYMTWYNTSGHWIRTTNTITNDKLPAAINTAIQKDYAGYNIVKVEEETDKGEKKYEVKLEKGDEKIKLHFRPSGEIIKAKTKS